MNLFAVVSKPQLKVVAVALVLTHMPQKGKQCSFVFSFLRLLFSLSGVFG